MKYKKCIICGGCHAPETPHTYGKGGKDTRKNHHAKPAIRHDAGPARLEPSSPIVIQELPDNPPVDIAIPPADAAATGTEPPPPPPLSAVQISGEDSSVEPVNTDEVLSQSAIPKSSHDFHVGITYKDNLSLLEKLHEWAEEEFNPGDDEIDELKIAYESFPLGMVTKDAKIYILWFNVKHIGPLLIFKFDTLKKKIGEKWKGIFGKLNIFGKPPPKPAEIKKS